ncbi:MAG: serine/threonine protein kinase [Gemmatimonadota bacterium]|nr:serine/threonine protein kinase [Gemmatimonadota bacterium]
MMNKPAPIDETFLLVQSALAGEYSLERELGRGGMGIVYLAREVQLDRLVAIKVLPPHLSVNEELRHRFLRESQTAARLSHPNIVPVFRVGDVGGLVYFAMAYVEGETLTHRVTTKGPLVPHEGARILREAAWALAYAHARHIVHRDVKPDNILIEHGSGRAMLTDFGIAHVDASSARTDDGLVLGTSQYMSPEQAAGEPVDGRSDLYSLGIVAHFLLAGRVPFDAPSAAALLAKHLTEPAPPLASLVPGLPRQIGDAIDRCLAKNPADRFATGEALAEALTAATEPPREMPAPIRVWITKGEKSSGAGLFLIVYLSLGIVPFMGMNLWLGLIPLTLVGSAVVLPVTGRTRRVLKSGYGLEDLRSSIRQHWARRREEQIYEAVENSRAARFAIWGASALGWLAVAAGATLTAMPGREILMVAGGIVGTITVALGVIDAVRRRRVGRVGSMSLRFWNGKWGERVVALARVGLKQVAARPLAPQLTELAIGRATDVLYEGLPAAIKRNLGDLPATVRKLEADAHAMREQIDRLDTHKVQMERDAVGASRALAASAELGSVSEGRDRIAVELASSLEMARARLAATVAALENIRLGLLRLQLGTAPVASVTSALEAAKRVADQVGRVADASEELTASLKSPPSAS